MRCAAPATPTLEGISGERRFEVRTDELSVTKEGAAMAIKKTRTQCTTCHARCGVFVYSDEDNNIVKIEGDPENPKSFGVVCGAGMSQR